MYFAVVTYIKGVSALYIAHVIHDKYYHVYRVQYIEHWPPCLCQLSNLDLIIIILADNVYIGRPNTSHRRVMDTHSPDNMAAAVPNSSDSMAATVAAVSPSTDHTSRTLIFYTLSDEHISRIYSEPEIYCLFFVMLLLQVCS